MFERLDGLDREYDEVLARLADGDVLADRERFVELSRRAKELEPIATGYRAHRRATEDLAAARDMLGEASGEDREFLRAQIAGAEADLQLCAADFDAKEHGSRRERGHGF